MTGFSRFVRWSATALAVVVLGFLAYDALMFSRMQPRMIAFDPITTAEENLFLWTGAGLLFQLVFCLTALLHVARILRQASAVALRDIVVVICLVLSLLFVFSDFALLQDIMKQYQAGLSQPEWLLVYPLMGFQATATAFYLVYQRLVSRDVSLPQNAVLDSNLYLVAQYVGLVCGLLGLTFSALGYLFSRSWNLDVHTTFTMVLLLMPYGLVTGYWFLLKIRAKEQIWDEKQLQDVGKSSLVTLLTSTVIMTAVFIANYRDLGGITSMLWLPIQLFSVLFLFSLGNLYFSWKA